MYYVHMYGIGHTQPIWHVHIGKSRGYGVYRGVHRGWGAACAWLAMAVLWASACNLREAA